MLYEQYTTKDEIPKYDNRDGSQEISITVPIWIFHPLVSRNSFFAFQQSPSQSQLAYGKIESVSRDEKNLLCVFPKLLLSLGIVSKRDILAVDFSDFGGFQVLMFAKQTRKGRAIPVYFEILEYPIQKNSQNIFVMYAIKNLSTLLEFRPKLVFDRGFACPSIIEYLCEKKHSFVIRIKKIKRVIAKETEEILLVKESKKNDFKVIAYEQKNLRLSPTFPRRRTIHGIW